MHIKICFWFYFSFLRSRGGGGAFHGYPHWYTVVLKELAKLWMGCWENSNWHWLASFFHILVFAPVAFYSFWRWRGKWYDVVGFFWQRCIGYREGLSVWAACNLRVCISVAPPSLFRRGCFNKYGLFTCRVEGGNMNHVFLPSSLFVAVLWLCGEWFFFFFRSDLFCVVGYSWVTQRLLVGTCCLLVGYLWVTRG